MATGQTLSHVSSVGDNAAGLDGTGQQAVTTDRHTAPVYVPPNEFRMKLLKRILSVDGQIDQKAWPRLRRHSSDGALQANILFQNGDGGTLISFASMSDSSVFKERPVSDKSSVESSSTTLPNLPKSETVQDSSKPVEEKKRRERPLKLPPIMLPPVYSVPQRPLLVRDFSGPPYIPPGPTNEEWEDLQDCRYIRPALKKFRSKDEKKKLVL